MSISARLLSAMIAMVLLTAVVGGYAIYVRLAPTIIESAATGMAKEASELSEDLRAHVSRAAEDALALAAIPGVRGIVNAENTDRPTERDTSGAQWRAALAQLMVEQLRIKPTYLQFRLIGLKNNGREIVRVDRSATGDRVEVVEEAMLQEKANTVYFQEAMKLPPGEIYISRIELNREHGQIQVPQIPVLRVATVIPDAAGKPFGILVINLDLRPVFDRLKAAAREGTRLYLVNGAGDYLLHPDPSQTFGFETGKSFKFQTDFPALAGILNAVTPLASQRATRDGAVAISYSPVNLGGLHDATIIEAIEVGVLLRDFLAAGTSAAYAAAGVVALAALLAVLLARALARPVNQIARAAEALAQGKSAPLPTDEKGEIGTLARTFERMASDIHQNSAALIAANEGLALRERNLLEAKSVYQGIFDSSDVAIIDKDFSGIFALVQRLKSEGYTNIGAYVGSSKERARELNSLHRINKMNLAARELLGYGPNETVVRLSGADGESAPAWIYDITNAMFDNTRRLRKETEFLAADGTIVSGVLSLLMPMTVDAARRIPLVLLDLTDVKMAEVARQANVAKTDFLSSMSHEIRTPLNGILGNLELLAHTHLQPDQVELIDSADKASKSLLALVGNILDFSKIEAGKLSTEFNDFSPCDVMGDAVDVLQSVARQKNTFIATYYADTVPEIVRGDESRIRQILLNLIGNAVKFTDVGGIQVRVLARPLDQENCILRYEIHDSGSGFDPADSEKLFDPFTQGHVKREMIQGTGLGLSICRKLIEMFGGSIGCVGVAGEGASFWFEIPMPVVRPAQPVPRANLTGKRVLIVSTKTPDKGFSEYFESRGASIVFASGRESSLATAMDASDRKAPYDLAVLYSMPVDESWTAFSKQLRDYGTVPMAYVDDKSPTYRRRALRCGFPFLVDRSTSSTEYDRNITHVLGTYVELPPIAALHKNNILARFSGVHGHNILVLEDSLINQAIISKQLRALGLTFTVAADGMQGLEELDKQAFDLILCDCSMPVMNGFEFTRRVRSLEKVEGNGRHRIIIALTANAFREDEIKCRNVGMDDFLAKPATISRLGLMLEKWLRGESWARQAGHTDAVGPKDTHEASIDLDSLTEILGTDDRDLQSELLGGYISTAHNSLKDIKYAASTKDIAKITSLAHRAKGDARSMGANALGAVYAAVEKAAKNNDTDEIELLLGNADQAVHNVETFISNYLRETP